MVPRWICGCGKPPKATDTGCVFALSGAGDFSPHYMRATRQKKEKTGVMRRFQRNGTAGPWDGR